MSIEIFTGLWSLPPSCSRTVREAFLLMSFVAKARSGDVEVSHLLEKKVGGSSGSFSKKGFFQSASPLSLLHVDQLQSSPMLWNGC